MVVGLGDGTNFIISPKTGLPTPAWLRISRESQYIPGKSDKKSRQRTIVDAIVRKAEKVGTKVVDYHAMIESNEGRHASAPLTG